jgi:hypothetical protein
MAAGVSGITRLHIIGLVGESIIFVKGLGKGSVKLALN